MFRLSDDRYAALYLLLLGLAVVLIINPAGDFPLNDDWSYAHNAFALAQGRWFVSDWPAMTLVAHTAWGALWCKVLGASFTVLRWSTLVLGGWGVWGFYRLLRWAEVQPHMAFFGTVVLMFNPLWVVSSFSYMTDVPFVAVLIWATLWAMKALHSARLQDLAIFTVLALWACMIRQLGLLLPVVFVPLYVWQYKDVLRKWPLALIPFALCYGSVSAYEGWLRQTDQLPEAYTGLGHMLGSLKWGVSLFKQILERSGGVALLLGFFLIPLSVSDAPIMLRRKVWWALTTVLLVVACIMAWGKFPLGNVFYNLGLGAVVLERTESDDPALYHLGSVPLFLLRAVSLIGVLLLTVRIWYMDGEKSEARAHLAFVFCLVFGGAYWGFTCLNWLIFDRYVMPLLPYVIMAFLLALPQQSKPLRSGHGVWTILALALFSIIGTRDYMTWNGARFAGLARLEAQGVPPDQIGGGFEYRGFHQGGPGGSRAWAEKAWWFREDLEWMVSMHGLHGYEVGFVVPYQRWLPPHTDSIWFNRCIPLPVADSVYCDMERLTPDSSGFVPTFGALQPINGSCRAQGRAWSGKWATRLHKDCPYGMTTPLDTFSAHERLLIQVWRYPARAGSGIVVAAENGDLFWEMETSYSTQRDSAGWRLLTMQLTVPEKAKGQRGKFFLWNASERDTVWYDDLRVWRWRSNEK